jgi:hypothetical protein
MDANIIVVGLSLLGAEVVRNLGDRAAQAVWLAFEAAWIRRFGKAPAPGPLSDEDMPGVVGGDPELADQLSAYIGQSRVMQRLSRGKDLLQGASVLWVDDHPEGNRWEIAALEAAGVRVRTVETTRAALAVLPEGYHLVISDVARGANSREGLDALPALARVAPGIRVILYVGKFQPAVPPGAFGITNRPDELLHLVMDALERIDRRPTG